MLNNNVCFLLLSNTSVAFTIYNKQRAIRKEDRITGAKHYTCMPLDIFADFMCSAYCG